VAHRGGRRPVPEPPRRAAADAELDELLGELDEAFGEGPAALDEAPTPLVSKAADGTPIDAPETTIGTGRGASTAVSGEVLAELLKLRSENERLRALVALVREVRRLETAFEERGNQADFRAFQQARNKLDAALSAGD